MRVQCAEAILEQAGEGLAGLGDAPSHRELLRLSLAHHGQMV